jgi:peptidyl-dipeptidase A
VHLGWNYNVNITKENEKAMTAQSLLTAPFRRLSLPIIKKFNEYIKYSEDEDLRRIFNRLSQGSISDNDKDVEESAKLHSELESIYAKAQVCEPNDKTKCYTLSPYLERAMQIEKNYDRLLWAWKGWHDQCGNKIRPVYLPYIDLLNKNAQENGFKDLSVNKKISIKFFFLSFIFNFRKNGLMNMKWVMQHNLKLFLMKFWKL